MNDSLRDFLSGIIDYAGLFPPAELSLAEAVHNHGRYLKGDCGWLLGRFVVPVARLRDMKPGSGFPLAVIVPVDISPGDIDLLTRFRHRIRLVEVRLPEGGDAVQRPAQLLAELHRRLAMAAVEGAILFVEAADSDMAATATAAFKRNHGDDRTIRLAGLKLRCGGTGASAAPSPEEVTAAIALCRRHDVSLKFTAGLHQPLAKRTSGAVQHGFLNIFAAAMLHWAGHLPEPAARDCLLDDDPSGFSFTDEGFSWCSRFITKAEIRKLRAERIFSFGSCSFEEPMEGLRALGLLEESVR